jgi:hypothetical protein
MMLRHWIGFAAFAAGLFAAATTTLAQPSPTPLPYGPYGTRPPGQRPLIEVNPRPLLYRRCIYWYELQYRPSGTVLFPAQHCWWVR